MLAASRFAMSAASILQRLEQRAVAAERLIVTLKNEVKRATKYHLTGAPRAWRNTGGTLTCELPCYSSFSHILKCSLLFNSSPFDFYLESTRILALKFCNRCLSRRKLQSLIDHHKAWNRSGAVEFSCWKEICLKLCLYNTTRTESLKQMELIFKQTFLSQCT